MKNTIYLFIFSFIVQSQLFAELQIKEYGQHELTYWLVYDDSQVEYKDNLVVFLHGFGAKSPSAYAGWIHDLTGQGFVVAYPMFQTGVFIPRTRVFQSRVDSVISLARQKTSQLGLVTTQSISLIGHSIGGVIAANLADQYGRSKRHQVNSVVLAQPGYKYLKLGRLDNYDGISGDAKMMFITGDKDYSAGDKHARFIFEHSPQVSADRKFYIKHFQVKNNELRLTAGHKAPTAPNGSLLTNHENFVTKACQKICNEDAVDELVYWAHTSLLLSTAPEDIFSLKATIAANHAHSLYKLIH